MTPGAIKNNSHVKPNQIRAIVGASLFILLVVWSVEAAYVEGRPITQTGGRISQNYLWGGNGIHRGVDFPYNTGVNVFAIANGTVVDLEEGIPNGENEDDLPWGNYVVIRHDQRHYDRTTGQWAYVYSIYLHLSELSVQPIDDEHVLRGEWIANVDNTGNTSGPTGFHLHLQIIISPESNGTLVPNTLDTEDISRNAELWLPPYQYQGANTARVVGKVTDTSGNPVGNLVICGMVKPYQAPSGVSFRWARTYSPTASWMNPDDILVENFATTDVSASPGGITYHLYARTYEGSGTDCATAPLYRDLGTYTFQANKTTYVGLYPMYLPMLRESSTRNSTIATRNNSTSDTAKAATTFVRNTGQVSPNHHRTDNLAPHDHILFSPPSTSFFGSARVVGSRDDAVGAQIEYCSDSYCAPAGYSGLTPELGVGTRGWKKVGTTIYVPLVKNRFINRTSEIYVTNVGTDDTSFTVTYYYTNGVSYNGGVHQLSLDATSPIRVDTSAPQDEYYSARIVSNNGQPLAVVVLEGDGYPPSSRPAMYNGFSAGHTTLYAPIVKEEYPNSGTPSESTTGITIQNITTSPATITAYYYDMSGSLVATVQKSGIPAYSPYVLFNPDGVPDGFLGSVRIVSNQTIVGQASESNAVVGGSRRMMSNLALGNATSRTVVFPLWYDRYTGGGRDWVCGVNVRHAGLSGPTTVTARWYNSAGSYTCQSSQTLDNERDAANFYNESCPEDIGSLVLESSSQNIVAVASCADVAQNNFVNDIVFTINGSNR